MLLEGMEAELTLVDSVVSSHNYKTYPLEIFYSKAIK